MPYDILHLILDFTSGSTILNVLSFLTEYNVKTVKISNIKFIFNKEDIIDSDNILRKLTYFNEIRYIEFDGNWKLGNYAILDNLTNLTHLSITNNNKISDIDMIPISDLTNLKFLNLDNSMINMTDAWIGILDKLKNLRSLSLSHIKINKYVMKIITRFEDLKELTLSNTFLENFIDNDYGYWNIIELSDITYLNLSNTLIIDMDLENFSEVLTKLEYIDIKDCIEITEEGVNFLLKLPNLKTINILDCINVNVDNIIDSSVLIIK